MEVVIPRAARRRYRPELVYGTVGLLNPTTMVFANGSLVAACALAAICLLAGDVPLHRTVDALFAQPREQKVDGNILFGCRKPIQCRDPRDAVNLNDQETAITAR